MAAPDLPPGENEIRWLSPAEAKALFDAQARKLLGISGEEFLRRWDAGEYDAIEDDPAHPEIMRLVLLSSLAR
jgi:hypothetical protein